MNNLFYLNLGSTIMMNVWQGGGLIGLCNGVDALALL